MKLESELLRQCWFLAGPTAAGKTAVGLLLARRLDAEIVALDSMTLYRRMDIGTAKPSREERAIVPHHLIDILEPHEEFSVSDYVAAAGRACRSILSRGRVPLFVGGAGLYLRSLLRGVFDGPPADWPYRRSLEQQAREQAPGWLHVRLGEIDPVAASRLHPADERRIIRALEVQYLTGKPASEQQQETPLPPSDRPQHVYWLQPQRDWLYRRIERRVDAMMEAGLVEEVQSLLADNAGLSRTARQALGYKEIIAHLSGEDSLDAAIASLKTRTRQFAKRQLTWFRNLVECRPVCLTSDVDNRADQDSAGHDDGERLVRECIAAAFASERI